MKVSDIAKELNTTSDDILQVLKFLKLKAKDSDQELSSVVASIVRSEYSKAKKQIALEKPALVKESPKAVEDKEKEPKEKIVKEKAPKEIKEKKIEVTKKKVTEEKKESPAKKTVEKKPKETKLIIKKTTKVVKKPVIEEAPKTKPKISREPLITLKPLARKKKKMGPGESGHERFTGPTSEQETISEDVSSSHETKQDSGTTVQTSSTSPQAATANLQALEIRLPITVKDFSVRIQQKPSVVLMRLMKYGLMAHINMSLDGEIVTKLAQDFGFALTKIKTQEEQLVDVHKTAEEDPKLLSPRAPIVTIMGHVDHGKTTLLDRLRKSRVADSEHGGITQHMGAYSINVPKGRITFLDTPGHEAFTSMRARGAHITDLVVLVVAADEGIMPQTEEAIDHARAAQVPIVVAINKIDSRNANLDRVKKQLSDIDLMPEDWGGKTVTAGVSALTGEGVDNLLDLILLEAELLELKANPNKNASGIIVEAHLSKGKGVLVTLIVQSGTLNEGDIVVVGPQYGKIKAMFDDNGRPIKSAGPSMPVEILGMPAVPEPGEQFYVLNDERQARDITGVRHEQLKNERLGANQKMTLEELYSKIQDGAVKELSVVLKADVQGSLEALRDSLAKIPSDKVKIRFIHTGVGDVNTSDVLLAAVSKGIIIGFHVDIDSRAKQELEKQPVEVKQYRIIYDAVNDIRNALEGLLEAKSRKKPMAKVEIRQVFKLSKHGIIAGCYVAKGKVLRKAHADVVRNGEVVHSGTISSLKRFKDDVRDVTEGMECGISVSGYDKYEVGDIIEVYELEMIAQKL
jgi:translation initiation factor IF-2